MGKSELDVAFNQMAKVAMNNFKLWTGPSLTKKCPQGTSSNSYNWGATKMGCKVSFGLPADIIQKGDPHRKTFKPERLYGYANRENPKLASAVFLVSF